MRTSAVAACLVLVGLSSGADAEEVFHGSLLYTAASNCQFSRGGNQYNSVYHPRRAGNLNFTSLTQIHDLGGAAYHLDGLNFDATFRTVKAAGSELVPKLTLSL